MLLRRNSILTICAALLGMTLLLSCTNAFLSLDQMTVQLTIPTPVPTRMTLPPSVTLFDVHADQGWQDTGLSIEEGRSFQVSYVTGQVVDLDTRIEDGTGSNYVCGRASCCEPLSTARRSALIGKVGNKVFLIGNGGSFSTPSAGQLLLRLNDCDEGLYDNRGSLTVGISP